MVRDSAEHFRCPNCSHGELDVIVTENLGLSEASGLRGASGCMIDGFPDREYGRSTEYDGSSSFYDTTRSEGGSAVQRSIELSEPYRRRKDDVIGEDGLTDKQREEVETVARILGEYNRAHGSNFNTVESEESQAHVADVWIRGSASNQASVPCQVTRVDRRDTTGRALADCAIFNERTDEARLIELMWKAIERKRNNLGGVQGVVLVLDAWVLDSSGLLDRFKAEYAEALASSPFAEIWYSGRGVGAMIKRLK
jgi:hypothetical protein